MNKRYFTAENTPSLSANEVQTLNRAARIYLFGTSKKDVSREQLVLLRSFAGNLMSAEQIAEALHENDEKPGAIELDQ